MKRQNRPEIHFTGTSLSSQLVLPSELAHRLKSETEIPEFLKIYDKLAAPSDSDSTTMYTEMTLKNQRYNPQFPLRAPEPPPPVVKSLPKQPPAKPIKPPKPSKKEEPPQAQ